MLETAFIVTIDTEGDNLWERPQQITTRNAAYLPRFQALCERYGFKPVYLTNYEMAMSEPFVEFARDVLARDTGEVGMHLHAWNSPPLRPLTGNDFGFRPYLIEYPEPVMREKIHTLTRLLEDRFERRMVSHRAGRWALDGRYAAMLLDAGYRVDCSVTPGIDWSANLGHPQGGGGSDYADFPDRPYFLDCSDISARASSGLLEVPMTVRASALYRRARVAYRIPFLRRVANRVSPALSWLSPIQPTLSGSLQRNMEAMLQVARSAEGERAAYLQFMLHSSELMPGGSPAFRDATDIDYLYEHLEILFEELAHWCFGATLQEFGARLGQLADSPATAQPLPVEMRLRPE